ncbi:hypothetical protein F5Y03DRAFT_161015 [Xylaria venustula]|nr:hypothetical protein F5Y03DRAFT_161015 [Xylaria venustula]
MRLCLFPLTYISFHRFEDTTTRRQQERTKKTNHKAKRKNCLNIKPLMSPPTLLPTPPAAASPICIAPSTTAVSNVTAAGTFTIGAAPPLRACTGTGTNTPSVYTPPITAAVTTSAIYGGSAGLTVVTHPSAATGAGIGTSAFTSSNTGHSAGADTCYFITMASSSGNTTTAPSSPATSTPAPSTPASSKQPRTPPALTISTATPPPEETSEYVSFPFTPPLSPPPSNPPSPTAVPPPSPAAPPSRTWREMFTGRSKK